MTIQRKKKARQDPSSALVAIYERMIASHAKSIGCCQCYGIVLAIKPPVYGAREGRFEHGLIAHAGSATMFG